jgi:hypothetical protein
MREALHPAHVPGLPSGAYRGGRAAVAQVRSRPEPGLGAVRGHRDVAGAEGASVMTEKQRDEWITTETLRRWRRKLAAVTGEDEKGRPLGLVGDVAMRILLEDAFAEVVAEWEAMP